MTAFNNSNRTVQTRPNRSFKMTLSPMLQYPLRRVNSDRMRERIPTKCFTTIPWMYLAFWFSQGHTFPDA